MKKNFISNFLAFLTILFFSTWFGSYITRQVTVYQLFEPINMDLKPLYTSQNLGVISTILLPSLLTNIISFILFLVCFIAYILLAKINIKKEGWLFLTLMVVLITAPFELYLLTSIDYKVIKLILASSVDTNEIVSLLRKRITQLSSFPLIEVFSYAGLIFLVIFKPLRKNEN